MKIRELIKSYDAQGAIKDAWFNVQFPREKYSCREYRIPSLNDIFTPAIQSISAGMVVAPLPAQYPLSSVYLLEVVPDDSGLPRKTAVVEAVSAKAFRVTWREIEKSDIERVLNVMYSPPRDELGWPIYSAIRINVPEHPSCWRVGKQALSLLEGGGSADERVANNIEKLIDSAAQARHWIPARALIAATRSWGEEWAVALIRSKEYSIVALEKHSECLALDVLDEMLREEQYTVNKALTNPDRERMVEALRILAQADMRRKIRKLLSFL